MGDNTNKVSVAVIRRLPIYHRYLTEMMHKDIDRISSSELSKLTGFTASQIRQDLNNFGGFGQQGYGYNVKDLREQIATILGMDNKYKVIVVGAGRLGSAVSRYKDFSDSGFKIQALFDSDPNKVGQKVDNLPVLNHDDMRDYIKKNNVEVAFVTVPKESAVDVINELVDCGIKGIWNFAPVDVHGTEDVIIENIRLNDSLLKLSYYLKERKDK